MNSDEMDNKPSSGSYQTRQQFESSSLPKKTISLSGKSTGMKTTATGIKKPSSFGE